MKIKTFCIIFLISIIPLNVFSKENKDSTKIVKYYNLALKFKADTTISFAYLEEGRKIAKESNYLPLFFHSFFIQASILKQKNQLQLALRKLNEGAFQAKSNQFKKFEFIFAYETAKLFEEFHLNLQAIDYYHQALSLADNAKDSLSMIHKISSATILLQNYKETFKQLNHAFSIAQRIEDSTKIGISYYLVAKAFIDLSDVEEAEQYILKALTYLKNSKDKMRTSDALILYSQLLISKKEYPKALDNLKSATVYLEDDTQINFGKAAFLKSEIQYQSGKTTEALFQLQKAKSIFNKHQDSSNLAKTNLFIARIYSEMKEFNSANVFLQEASNLLRKNSNLPLQIEINQALSRNFTNLGDFKNALVFENKTKELIRIRESRLNELYYSYLKNDLKIETEKNHSLIKKIPNRITKPFYLILHILLSAGFATTLIFYYYKIKKKNKLLIEKEGELIKEKEQLHKIICETEAVLDNKLVGVLTTGPSRNVISVNEHFCELSGYTENEIIGNKTSVFFSNKLNYKLTIDESKKYFQFQRPYRFQDEFVKKNGSLVKCDVSGRPINFNNLNEGIIWVINDITETKLTELTLRSFKSFVDSSSQGFLIMDLEFNVLYLNKKLQDFLNLENDYDILKKSYYQFYPQNKLILVKNIILPRLLKGERWSGELEQVNKLGQKIKTLENYFAIKNDFGEVQFIANILTDISSIKGAEEKLKEVLRSKSQLISFVANGFKNTIPLVEQNLKDILINFHSFPEKELIAKLRQSRYNSIRTRHLLENIAMFSLIEKEEIKKQAGIFKIYPLIKKTLDKFEDRIIEKDLHVKITCDENTTVYADYDQMCLILINLISNAVKFNRQNGTIEVSCLKRKETTEFSVKDNGIGLNEDIIEEIYGQIPMEPKPGTFYEKGIGIGLLIVQKLLEMNESKLEIKSKYNQESILSFELRNKDKRERKINKNSEIPGIN